MWLMFETKNKTKTAGTISYEGVWTNR